MSYWRQCCFQILHFFLPHFSFHFWLKLMELHVNTSVAGLFVSHLPICLLFQWVTTLDMIDIFTSMGGLEEAPCMPLFTLHQNTRGEGREEEGKRGGMCCLFWHCANCKTHWRLFASLPSWPVALWTDSCWVHAEIPLTHMHQPESGLNMQVRDKPPLHSPWAVFGHWALLGKGLNGAFVLLVIWCKAQLGKALAWFAVVYLQAEERRSPQDVRAAPAHLH